MGQPAWHIMTSSHPDKQGKHVFFMSISPIGKYIMPRHLKPTLLALHCWYIKLYMHSKNTLCETRDPVHTATFRNWASFIYDKVRLSDSELFSF